LTLSDTVAVFFGRKTLPHWRTHPVNDRNGASAPPRSTATTTTNRGAHSTPHHPSYGGSNAHVEQKRSTSSRRKRRHDDAPTRRRRDHRSTKPAPIEPERHHALWSIDSKVCVGLKPQKPGLRQLERKRRRRRRRRATTDDATSLGPQTPLDCHLFVLMVSTANQRVPHSLVSQSRRLVHADPLNATTPR